TVSTPAAPSEVNLDGIYSRLSNVAWFDETMPSAVIHESMHRGINMLRKQGLLPAGLKKFMFGRLCRRLTVISETALMREGTMGSKNLKGNRLIEQNRSLKDHPTLSLLEELAAQEIARKHPRGPR